NRRCKCWTPKKWGRSSNRSQKPEARSQEPGARMGWFSSPGSWLLFQPRPHFSLLTQMELSERLKKLSPAKRALLLKALREEAEQSPDDQTISRRPAEIPPPLSFAQQRLWFLDQLQPGSGFYNMPMAVRLAGWLDIGALEQGVNEILCRHEALRTTFRMT